MTHLLCIDVSACVGSRIRTKLLSCFRHTAAAPRCRWWQLIKKRTAILPLPAASSQILWTGLSSLGASRDGKLACDSHLPGTCSSFAEVMEVWPHNLSSLALPANVTCGMQDNCIKTYRFARLVATVPCQPEASHHLHPMTKFGALVPHGYGIMFQPRLPYIV